MTLSNEYENFKSSHKSDKDTNEENSKPMSISVSSHCYYPEFSALFSHPPPETISNRQS